MNQDEVCPRDLRNLDHDGASQYLGTILKATRIDTAAQTQSNTSYPCRVPCKNATTTGGSKHQRADINSSLSSYASVRRCYVMEEAEELTCPATEAVRASATHTPRGSGTGRLTKSCGPLYRRCRARWGQRSRACVPRRRAPAP